MSHYCSRCDKQFNSASAKQQHIRDSPRHHICYICLYADDFETPSELNCHLKEEHFVCIDCDEEFDTRWDLTDHDVDVHNYCTTCGRYFMAPSNLRSHKLTHVQKDTGCPGCPRFFATDSAMMLHMEAGTCDSGVDLHTINSLAFECRQSWRYKAASEHFNFECPTCPARFVKMSSLLQHVESESCDEDLAYYSPLAILLRFVRSRVD